MVNDGQLYIWLMVEPTPLKNMNSSVGIMTFPIYGKNKTCSKPPTRKCTICRTNQIIFSKSQLIGPAIPFLLWVLLADFRGKLQGLPDKSGFSSGFSLEEATFLLAKMEFIPKQIRILTAFISGLLLFWPLQRPSVTNDASTTCFHMVRAWLEWFQVFLQPFQWLVVSAQEALPTFAIFSKFYETMMINPCILEPSILTQNHVVDRSSTLGHGDVFKLSILENL